VLEDEWLVVRCQLGERAAFDELIQRWHDPLWKYARRVTGDADAARDIMQEVWLRVLRGIGRLRDASRLRAWLFGIARRVLTDRWRERYAAPEAIDVDLSTIPAEPAPDDLEDDLASMQEELGKLPFVEREVLTLFYLRELSLSEVAEILVIPVGTVKSRLFRARQLLRRELEAKERQA
jgi:RNA polymerase sigma factor (sigma-70 family)